jgi:hypothetical protein
MAIRIKNIKKTFQNLNPDKFQSNKIKILGIFLFIIGILSFWNPLGMDIKTGLSVIFIAIYIFLFFPQENNNDYLIELYVFLFLFGWLIIMTFITNDMNFDTFFFSIVLGMLILTECTNGYLSSRVKKKLSILSLIFFSISMLLVLGRIISFFYGL